jgi:hypothetical protein
LATLAGDRALDMMRDEWSFTNGPPNNMIYYKEGPLIIFNYESKFLVPKVDEFLMIQDEVNLVMLEGSFYFGSEESWSERVLFKYTYSVDTKTLVFEPITVTQGAKFRDTTDGETVKSYLAEKGFTREDVEYYRDYFLYDVAMKNWTVGNVFRSLYTTKNPGEFTVVDNTFEPHCRWSKAFSCACATWTSDCGGGRRVIPRTARQRGDPG